MQAKHFLVRTLTLFFMLSTLITVAISVIGSAFAPEGSVPYADMLTPLRVAGCCVLPTLVMYSRRELTRREILWRMGLELVLIEAVVLLLAFTSPVIDTGRPAVVLSIAVSVPVIFGLVCLFGWLWNSVQANRMSAELHRFQQLHSR